VPDSAPDRSVVEATRADFSARLAAADSDQKLKALHDEFLSRKSGAVTGLMKTLGTLAPEARREFGQLVNTLKSEIETALDEKRAALESTRQPAGAVDVTLPCRRLPMGRIHPLMRVRREHQILAATATLALGVPVAAGMWIGGRTDEEGHKKALEDQITEAMLHKAVDALEIVDLKRRKLQIKDEIERIRREVDKG
jgi:hypothetical protein